VKARTGRSVVVDTGDSIVKAAIAFSCLIAPEADDVVLLSHTDGEWYALAILERPGGNDAALEFPGNVAMSAPNGTVDVHSSADLRLSSAAATQMVSKRMHVASDTIAVGADRIVTRASETESHVGRVQIFADAIDSVVKRVTQHADTVMRWVKQVETLSLGSFIQHVRQSMMSHSDQVVMTAKRDVRIDGERIHMG
jgi:hypothetical protein